MGCKPAVTKTMAIKQAEKKAKQEIQSEG